MPTYLNSNASALRGMPLRLKSASDKMAKG